MNLIETKLKGVYIIQNKIFKDERGVFVKNFNSQQFNNMGLINQFHEGYYSMSNQDVIRGMHFQSPPFDHEKLVFVAKGMIIDVILDIRIESDTYGKYLEVELSEENGRSIYMPKGVAHGFKSLKDGTITIYNVSTVYNQYSDHGILWNSFGYDWRISEPIISERDKSFVEFKDYKSKFY